MFGAGALCKVYRIMYNSTPIMNIVFQNSYGKYENIEIFNTFNSVINRK